MLLGQALLDLHLGRDFFWTPETRDPTYLKIVNRFEDTRRSPFSIHQVRAHLIFAKPTQFLFIYFYRLR